MSYADKRQVVRHHIKTADAAAALADNTDVLEIIIPANREVEIFAVRGYVSAASDGADFIELVKDDNTVLCELPLVATGHVSAVDSDGTTATTFPIKVAPQSTTLPKLLKLRVNGATDTSTECTIEVVMSDPGI